MAEGPSVAENGLSKLADQLTCWICLETYNSPKLLHCFHVFCEECLQRHARQGQNGSLICPNCRQTTQIPPNGAAGLPPAFHVHHLLEARDTLEKIKTNPQMQCEKCKRRNAISYCRDCGKFICPTCTEVHETWEEYASHVVVSLDHAEEDVAKLVPPSKKTVSYCHIHRDQRLELYCKTCGELICHNCTIHRHQGHRYGLVADAAKKHREELAASLKPVKQHLWTVEKAIDQLDACCQEIADQRVDVEAAIGKAIRRHQDTLEVRRTELLGQLDRLTQQKMRNIAAQRDEFELIHSRLSSCLDFIDDSLKAGRNGELLGVKKLVARQIQTVTAEFQPEVLTPKEHADLSFSFDTKLQTTCQQFGVFRLCPVSPEDCFVTGKGLKVAAVGEDTIVVLYTMASEGHACEKPIQNITCELISSYNTSTIKCSVKRGGRNTYEINYTPTTRGQHRLHVRVEGISVKGSPFNILVKEPVEKLGIPIRTINGLNFPWGVAVNERGEVIAVEGNGQCVSTFNSRGETVRVLGSYGSGPGQLKDPRGVALDQEENILVTDSGNHCIQIFSPDGKFIRSIGIKGSGPLQFKVPMGIAVGVDGRIYVCDPDNNRVQVLNADLTFHSEFGSHGSGDGQFKQVADVGLDSWGNVYTVEWGNNRIQVFTSDGHFVRRFGREGHGDGELSQPTSITISSDNMIFVAEHRNCRVSVFTRQGQFVRKIGGRGEKPGCFKYPRGLVLDKHGYLYVNDSGNARLQII